MTDPRITRSAAKKKTSDEEAKIPLGCPRITVQITKDNEALKRELFDFDPVALSNSLNTAEVIYIEEGTGELEKDKSTLQIDNTVVEPNPKKALNFGSSSMEPDPLQQALPVSSDSESDPEEVSDPTFSVELPHVLCDPALSHHIFALLRSISCAGPENANWKDVFPREVDSKSAKVVMSYRPPPKSHVASSTTTLFLSTSAPSKETAVKPPPPAAISLPSSSRAATTTTTEPKAGPSRPSKPITLAANPSGDLYFILPHIKYPSRKKRVMVKGTYVAAHPELVENIPKLVETYLREVKLYTYIDGQFDVTKAVPE